MIIQVDQNSSVPIYVQIYDAIVSNIASGELGDGDVLPSARKLAKDLGINYHTSNKAYNLLEIEGFAMVRNKKTVVTKSRGQSDVDQFTDRLAKAEEELVLEAKAKGIGRAEIENICAAILNRVYKN